MTKKFKKMLKDTGFEELPWRNLRHTFATMGRSAGMTLEDLQDLLGHASYDTTKKFYAATEIEPLIKATDKFSTYAGIDHPAPNTISAPKNNASAPNCPQNVIEIDFTAKKKPARRRRDNA